MADAFDKLPLTFRGTAALSEARDGYSFNPFERTDLFFAKVVQVHQASRTINCIGLNSHQNERFENVWVLANAASQKEGSTWLPKIDPILSRSSSTAAILENSRDVIAILTFVEKNPNIPICIGFIYPQENEFSFEDPYLKIERHSSDVYERLTSKGNYEFVFPDKTFIKIAAETDPEEITDLSGKNIHNKTHPWKIVKDFDRKITISHSTKNRLRISSEGVYIDTYASSGSNVGQRTGGYGFAQDGNLVLSGKQIFVQNISSSNPATITVSGVVQADGYQLGGTSITDVINASANTIASQVVGQYFGGSGGSGGSGSGGTITLSPDSIAANSISIEKLNFIPVLKSDFDTHVSNFNSHVGNTSIHLTIGTSSTTAAAGDHTHSVYAQNGTITWGSTGNMSLTTGTSNSAGSGSIAEAARIDHRHGISITSLSAAPANISIGATNSVGSSTTAFARADHVHGTPLTWTPSAHTHAYTDLTSVSNAISFSSGTVSLFNTSNTSSFTLNPTGSVVLSGTTVDLVGTVKINGVTITGSSSGSSSGTSSTGSYSAYFLKNTTIGSVTKNLTMDGSDFYSSANQIKLAANSSFGFRADISAATSTGNAGALWVVEGVVRRSSDISSITLQDVRLVNSYVDPSLSSCSVSVDVDAAIFGSLIFYTQGASSLTIYWTADVTMFGDPALLPVAPNAGGGSGSSGGSSSSITFPAPGGSLPSVNDDADYGVYVLKGYSTSASSVRLTTDGLVSTISNVPILSDNTSWVTDITVAAHVAGTSAGVWKYSGLFRRGASASSTTFLGPLTQEEIMDANFESAVVSILADTTFGGINISVTGLAGISSNWIAVIHATELR